MARARTEIQKAAGKLISSVQKKWTNELGESVAGVSEATMNRAHELLQAGTAEGIKLVLGSRSITEYLGELWVIRHPTIKPAITKLEEAIVNECA